MSQLITLYHYIIDSEDIRDYPYVMLDVPEPDIVDLRKQCSAVDTQGPLGSCTGQAITSALELLMNIKSGKYVDLSRLFVYYNERQYIHTTNRDSGASLRDGIKSLVQYGVCLESKQPYNIKNFNYKPQKSCYIDATTRKIHKYTKLNTLADKINCLASGFPFVCGFKVFDSFLSETTETTGIIDWPDSTENSLGQHAVCVVGYDKSKELFIIKNSYGTTWGDGGYGYIPFEYLNNIEMSKDFQQIIS